MFNKIPCALVFCLLCQPFSFAQQASTIGESETMTEEEALSILRSRTENAPDAGFVVIRKIEPDASARQVGSESLAEARAKNLELYENGVLANLLRVGGYVALEFNERSDVVAALHLVTRDEAGEPLIDSLAMAPPDQVYGSESDGQPSSGKLTRDEALRLLRRHEEFSEALFNSPISKFRETVRNFGGTRAEAGTDANDPNCLEVLEGVGKLSAPPDEVNDFVSQACGPIWFMLRYALTLPIYSADPHEGLSQGEQAVEGLMQEFAEEQGESSNCTELLDPDTIKTSEELTARIQCLKAFNAFLDNRLPTRLDSATYRANLLLSTVPLTFELDDDHGRTEMVMSATMLVSGWSRTKDGGLALRIFTVPSD